MVCGVCCLIAAIVTLGAAVSFRAALAQQDVEIMGSLLDALTVVPAMGALVNGQFVSIFQSCGEAYETRSLQRRTCNRQKIVQQRARSSLQ
jgi:hypothetical protein